VRIHRLAILVSVLLGGVPSVAAAAGWSRPYTLSSTDLAEPAPRVAVGPEGHVVVAWLRRNGDLRAEIGDSHGHFRGSRTLSSRGLRPRVSVGRRGRAIVVWNEKGLKYAIRAPGHATFGAPRALTTPTGSSTDDAPVLAMDGSGRTTVLFEHGFRTRSGYHQLVEALDISAAGTPGPIVSFGEGRLPRRATLAITAAGDMITTFFLDRPPTRDPSTPDPGPMIARRQAGGAWSVRPFPFSGGRRTSDPSVAVDPVGRATFSFTDVVESGEAVSFGSPRVSTGPLAGPLGPPVGPVPARADKAFGPFALPLSDAIVLVWQEKTRARPFSTEAPVRAVRVAFNGAVGRPHTLDSSESSFEPHVVRLDSGRALVVWDHKGIAAALYRAGHGFQRIAAPPGEATLNGTDFNVNRDLASNGRGVAAFTWTQGNRVKIAVRRF
jgi:hypothetical protein